MLSPANGAKIAVHRDAVVTRICGAVRQYRGVVVRGALDSQARAMIKGGLDALTDVGCWELDGDGRVHGVLGRVRAAIAPPDV